MEQALAKLQEYQGMPPSYTSHPVVSLAPPALGSASVFPFGIYVDAVAFARDESAIGFWLFDILTDERWLLTALRKDDLCNCSCKGWCSFYSVFAAIAWSLEAMKRGFYPGTGPDNAEFAPTDAARSMVVRCESRPANQANPINQSVGGLSFLIDSTHTGGHVLRSSY